MSRHPSHEPPEPTTFHQLAGVDAQLEGGRFAQDRIVSGSAPSVEYPRLPASSPWSGPQPGPEEPLGWSVAEVPICGEPHEVARSQEFAQQDSAPSWFQDVGGDDSSLSGSSSETPAGRTPTHKPMVMRKLAK
jgi:hypothetical protein